jgi:intracellular sulfur oxidation DsrE/DsrF family protein
MRPLLLAVLLTLAAAAPAEEAQVVETPYSAQKVVFDFYFNDPTHINSGLNWVRVFMNTLTETPYSHFPDDLSIKIVVHGAEIVTLAEKNYEKYRDAVERMRYYADFGVAFKVCGLAAHDFGYAPEDFYDFVTIVPSAMNELVHWQEQGHALLIPQMLEKRFSIEEIR